MRKIKLDKETINQRFRLKDDEGSIVEIFGVQIKD